MEYDIIDGDSIEELREKVKERIENGWKLLGGMAIDGGEEYIKFYQTMTRERKRVWVFDGEKFVSSKELDPQTYNKLFMYSLEDKIVEMDREIEEMKKKEEDE